MGKLQGKTAIVTGATGGIGVATSKLFLEEGANVMLVGRSPEKLKATRDALAGGDRLASSVADAADEAATAAAVAATVKAFGGVDILVANAGDEGVMKTIEGINLEDFERLLRTNVIGVWLAMKHCVEPMKQRGGGSMIAMASVAGLVGYAGGAPYVASKHAVCGLVKSAALELGNVGNPRERHRAGADRQPHDSFDRNANVAGQSRRRSRRSPRADCHEAIRDERGSGPSGGVPGR